ncbi:MAG: hypothetical protein IT539_06355 [Bradyrhizobiaceae bacterium]|nr:hypothetical protein [Bradyrhizobiaceae bacterium]
MATSREFRRAVLGLHQSVLDRAMVDLAADFAQLLRLDMFGFFIEEPGVSGLAGLPFAREFRMLGREWRPLDVERIAREMELSALTARRLVTQAAAAHRISCSFEVVRARTEQAIASISQASDIVIIAEPKSAVDRIAGAFPGLAAAAFRSKASVLLLPRRVARAHGPIAALAAAPGDPAIDAALSIAAAARENAVILAEFDRASADATLPAAGLEFARLPAGMLANERYISSVLDRYRERLLVVTRGALGEGAEPLLLSLASARGVPVLIVEPAETGH